MTSERMGEGGREGGGREGMMGVRGERGTDILESETISMHV